MGGEICPEMEFKPRYNKAQESELHPLFLPWSPSLPNSSFPETFPDAFHEAFLVLPFTVHGFNGSHFFIVFFL